MIVLRKILDSCTDLDIECLKIKSRRFGEFCPAKMCSRNKTIVIPGKWRTDFTASQVLDLLAEYWEGYNSKTKPFLVAAFPREIVRWRGEVVPEDLHAYLTECEQIHNRDLGGRLTIDGDIKISAYKGTAKKISCYTVSEIMHNRW